MNSSDVQSEQMQFDAIARLAAAALEVPFATLSLVHAEVSRLGGAGVAWAVDEELALLRWVARGEGAAASAVVGLDLTSMPEGFEGLRAYDVTSACMIPLRDGATVFAVLAVYSHGAIPLSHLARRRLVDLGQVAAGLIRAQRAERARAVHERGARMCETLSDLLRGGEWQASLPIVVGALAVRRVVVWNITPTQLISVGGWPALAPGVSWREAPLPPSPTLMRALAEGALLPISDLAADPRVAEISAVLRDEGVASVLIVPVRAHGRPVLALAFESTTPRRWTADELRYGAALAGWLAPLVGPPAESAAPKLGTAEQRVLAYVNATKDRVMIHDQDARIVYVNPAWARAAERTPSELVGHLVGPNRERLVEIARDPRHPIYDEPVGVHRVELPGGRRRSWEVSLAPIEVDGARYVGITARDQNEVSQRLEATMVGVGVPIAHVGLDGSFLRFNQLLPALLGRASAELDPDRDTAQGSGARALSFVEALGLEGSLDLVVVRAQLAATASPYERAHSFARPDGRVVDVVLTLSLVRDTSARPAYFVAVVRDVTQARRAHDALRDLAEVLARDGAALLEGVCGFVAGALQARCVWIGRQRGTRIEPLAAWRDDAPAHLMPYELQATASESLRRGELTLHGERVQRVFPQDPLLAELDAECLIGSALCSSDGRALGVLVAVGTRPFAPVLAAEDVMRLCATRVAAELHRQDASAVLSEREAQLRQIAESAQETFWIAETPSWRALYISPSYEALIGQPVSAALVGRERWELWLHPEDRAEVLSRLDALADEPFDRTVRILRPDGQLRWVQLRASLILDPMGTPYRIAGSFSDITKTVVAQLALADREQQLAEALAVTEREVETLQRRLGEVEQLNGMVGSSAPVRAVFRRLRQAAPTDVTVLIAGESGTGKELAAHALHAMSPRRARPFVAINCSAIPEPLLESELFGHVRGAFTGAARDKVGLMQAAEGGTLFLDEIGDMSPVLQVKLLRALQERQIRRVGDERSVAIDVRLISASHRDLRALVASGRMREDFYYRIKVFEIEMPALRERRDDIPALAHHFVEGLGGAVGKPGLTVASDAMQALLAHRWPGNVRELRNAIEHALVTVTGSAIQLADLPIEIRAAADPRPGRPLVSDPPASSPPNTSAPADVDLPLPADPREQIREVLRRSGGNRAEAARMLGIGRVTLWKRMRKLGMAVAEVEPASPDEE